MVHDDFDIAIDLRFPAGCFRFEQFVRAFENDVPIQEPGSQSLRVLKILKPPRGSTWAMVTVEPIGPPQRQPLPRPHSDQKWLDVGETKFWFDGECSRLYIGGELVCTVSHKEFMP